MEYELGLNGLSNHQINQDGIASFIGSYIMPKENSGSSFGGIAINTINTIIKKE